MSIPADFEKVRAPLSLALGDKDSLLGEKEVGQIKELMEKKKSGEQGTKVESEVRIYGTYPELGRSEMVEVR